MQKYTLNQFKKQHPYGVIANVRLNALAKDEDPNKAKVQIDGQEIDFQQAFKKYILPVWAN